MTQKILFTSFSTWRPDQKSNSSDDLLKELSQTITAPTANFLRQLPVDIPQASTRLLEEINSQQPDIIICCGMAEKRDKLTVESNACLEGIVIENWVDIHRLIANLKMTEISHDAGKFVCEGLYYSVLRYLRNRQNNSRCIFVHVPIITPQNSAIIQADFSEIIEKLTSGNSNNGDRNLEIAIS